MYIHNIRYGFATNSSSLHSIVLMNSGQTARNSYDSQEFGWDFFTLASEKAKREYMGQQVKLSFERVNALNEYDAAILASNWAGASIDPYGSIDHQSSISFPCEKTWNGWSVRRDFFDEMLNFVLNPEIVIVGGNDNSGEDHEIIANAKGKNILCSQWDGDSNNQIKLFLECSVNIRGRRDSKGNFWVLFNPDNGTKIRMSFDPLANANKSEAPELVDIKITDHCTKNCTYCYQGSSSTGKHADINSIYSVVVTLSKLNTFEVAIGGGEPTTHPKFIEILEMFHNNGIVPSFSTRDEQWIVDNWNRIKPLIGAIGLSIDSADVLSAKLLKLKPFREERKQPLKITVQVIVGSCSEDELIKILNVCNENDVTLLLLGWKSSNRGSCGPLQDVNLEKVLESFFKDYETTRHWNGPNLAFDTVLVQKMETWLNEKSNPWYFTKHEGAHSMYIDCVLKRMAKSSYSEEFVPFSSHYISADCIKNYFASL